MELPMKQARLSPVLIAALFALGLLAAPPHLHAESAQASSRAVADIKLDMLGNAQRLIAFTDPKVSGVVCYMTSFHRSLGDRALALFDKNRTLFVDPSNASLDCRVMASEVTLGAIDRSTEGERILQEDRSLIFKEFEIRRIYDVQANALIYIGYGTNLVSATAKATLSVVPLNMVKVTAKP